MNSIKFYTKVLLSAAILCAGAAQAQTFKVQNLQINGATTATIPIQMSAGGTGVATLPQYNVAIGTGSAFGFVAPGSTGTVLTSNGSAANPTFQVPAAAQLGAYTAPNASPASQTIQGQLNKIPVSCEDFGVCGTADDTATITAAMQYAQSSGRPFQFNNNYIVTSVQLIGGNALHLMGRGGLIAKSGDTANALLDIKNGTNGITMDGSIAFNCNTEKALGAAIKIWTDGAGGTNNTTLHGLAFTNCKLAIQFGDPGYTDFTVDSNLVWGGYMYNTAQGVAIYGSQSGLFVNEFINTVDNTNWTSTFTGSCTGTTLATAGVSGYLNKDDTVTGAGIPAGTTIVAQTSGTTGGAGNYTVSQSCTASSAALTSKVVARNYLVVGSTLHVHDGYVLNNITGGEMFRDRPVNSATHNYPYGRIDVQGSLIEGSDVILRTDAAGVASPGTGSFYLNNASGDFSGNTNTYILTDSAFLGQISVLGNRLFATVSRTLANISIGNAAVSVNYDLESFGSNMIQGYSGVLGGTQRLVTKDLTNGVTVSGTVTGGVADSIVTFNCASACTYTMPNAATYPGRTLYYNNVGAGAVTSASVNILNQSGVASSTLFPGTAGKWLVLISDQSQGNYWRIVANN